MLRVLLLCTVMDASVIPEHSSVHMLCYSRQESNGKTGQHRSASDFRGYVAMHLKSLCMRLCEWFCMSYLQGAECKLHCLLTTSERTLGFTLHYIGGLTCRAGGM